MTVKYLSQTDAANRLGLTRQRVSQLIIARTLRGKEIAGRVVISELELERFAAIPRKGGRPPSKE
jgi:DNA-binding Xre family transcriptional regulator